MEDRHKSYSEGERIRISIAEVTPHYEEVFQDVKEVTLVDVLVPSYWGEHLEDYNQRIIDTCTEEKSVMSWMKQLLHKEVGTGLVLFHYFNDNDVLPSSSFLLPVSAKIDIQGYDWIDPFWDDGGKIVFQAVDVPPSWVLYIDRGNPFSEYLVTATKVDRTSTNS